MRWSVVSVHTQLIRTYSYHTTYLSISLVLCYSRWVVLLFFLVSYISVCVLFLHISQGTIRHMHRILQRFLPSYCRECIRQPSPSIYDICTRFTTSNTILCRTKNLLTYLTLELCYIPKLNVFTLNMILNLN